MVQWRRMFGFPANVTFHALRHSAATRMLRELGIEAAATVLGHARADVTQIYAERDLAKAAAVMRQIG